MSRVFIALLFFLATVYAESIFHQAFLLDCTGGVQFFPMKDETTISLNLEKITKLYSFLLDKFFDRVQCVCPDVTKEGLLNTLPLGSPGFLFNQISQNPVDGIAGCDAGFLKNFELANTFPEFVLPTTCDWNKDKECTMQFDTGFDLKVQLAIAQCPSTALPFISVGCSGEMCEHFFKPCSADSMCGSFKCLPLMVNGYEFFNISVIESAMESLLLAEGDCVSAEELREGLATFLRSEIFGVDGAFSFNAPKFCLPDSESDGFSFDQLINQTRFHECEIIEESTFTCIDGGNVVQDPNQCPEGLDCYDPIDYYYYDNFEGRTCFQYGSCLNFDENATCIEKACNQYETDEFGYPILDTCKRARVSTEVSQVDCYVGGDGPLEDWNGMNDEGDNVLSYKTTNPYALGTVSLTPVTPGATPLVSLSCNMKLQFVPNTLFGFSFESKKALDVLNYLYDLYRERFDCEGEAKSFDHDDTTFAINYFMPSFLFLNTTDFETIEKYQGTVSIETFAGSLINSYTGTDGQFLNGVDTCNFDTWTNDGYCKFSYVGLADLLGLDITFNFEAKKCGDREYPSIYVECEGENCNLFNGLVACDPNDESTCPNAKCSSFDDLMELVMKDIYNSTEQIDFIADASGLYNDDTCPLNGYTKLRQEFNSVLGLFGIEQDSSICILDVDRLIETGEMWAQTQYTVDDEGRITLTALRSWDTTDVTVETGTGSDGSNDTETDSGKMLSLLLVGTIIASLI